MSQQLSSLMALRMQLSWILLSCSGWQHCGACSHMPLRSVEMKKARKVLLHGFLKGTSCIGKVEKCLPAGNRLIAGSNDQSRSDSGRDSGETDSRQICQQYGFWGWSVLPIYSHSIHSILMLIVLSLHGLYRIRLHKALIIIAVDWVYLPCSKTWLSILSKMLWPWIMSSTAIGQTPYRFMLCNAILHIANTRS